MPTSGFCVQYSIVEDVLLVEVIDNGAGIAKEDHHKVFREFSQFDRNKLQGGGWELMLWPEIRSDPIHYTYHLCIRWLWVGLVDFQADHRLAQCS